MNRTSLPDHCKNVHNRPARSLKVGDKPSKPRYSNWAEWVADPSTCNPDKIPDLLMQVEYSETSEIDEKVCIQHKSEIDLCDLIEEQTVIRSGRKFLDKPTQKGMALTRARPRIRDMCCNPTINK